MIVNNKTKGIPVSFSMDRMSKIRLDWIKANVPEVKPSGSMILRRALAMYVQHLENSLSDPEKFDLELVYLKAAASPEDCPWKKSPDFTLHRGTKLSSMVRENNRRKIDNFLNSSPFMGRAMANKRKEPLIHDNNRHTNEHPTESNT